ncbi:MAG: glyoxalase [Caulobacter sp.]|nr:glyoxalase [Caulobacter sp.]
MIGYTTIGINDLDRSKAFYDAVLKPLGGRQIMPTARGVLYGGGEGALFGITGPYDGQPATAGNGTMIALQAKDAATIQAVYDKAIEMGAACEGPPGERSPGFQGAYFRDLDGNKLCVFKMG